jgi:hypothetical protein
MAEIMNDVELMDSCVHHAIKIFVKNFRDNETKDKKLDFKKSEMSFISSIACSMYIQMTKKR